MTALPKYLRRAPTLFYAAAVIMLILNVALPLHELSRYGHSMSLPTSEGQFRLSIVYLVIRQITDSLYLAANGLILQTLIAIWDRLGARAVLEQAE